MLKQQVMAEIARHVRLPLWKRLMLITALLLSGESLVAVVSSQAAHASVAVGPGQAVTSIAGVPIQVGNVSFIACHAGDGGPGGISSHSNDGGRGGNGGDCLIHSAKAGGGGTSATGSMGGSVTYLP